MRKLFVPFALLAALVTGGCVADAGIDDSSSDVVESSVAQHSDTVLDTSDLTVKSSGNDTSLTAIFGTIKNVSDNAVAIVSLSTPAAKEATLHQIVDGKMVKPSEGVTIPAGESLTLARGETHIMLIDLASPLKAGDSIELTFTFDDGTHQLVTVPTD